MTRTNGIKLKELLNGTLMEVSSFIHIAITLTELVYTAHKRDTLIGDLNPDCIRIQLEKNLAVLTAKVKPDYAYLSPEQMGRINRTPDARSDLYALGMMYYEMLAGCLPFQAQSAEDWVHAHLAIMPRPLHELRPDMAGPLVDIIMKLLSKTPEERYQSAYGLLSDLKQCASSLEEMGQIVPFEIARTDEASRFRLPRTLFGREAEEEELRGAFEQARAGASAFVIVTGRAGIGKTALIRELQVPVTREGGQFIAGKCDQMNRDIPFSPILQALRRLIRQIWGESPERVAKLKAKLAETLGLGTCVIAELLPEAAMLLGDYPSVEPLPPAEAAIRFRRLFPAFIKIFADREHPLVMFLDDLQWADPATLDVLRAVAHDPTLHGLLVIGVFRSETAPDWTESGDDHAAAAFWIKDTFSFHKAETPLVQHIALNPLSYVDVRRFASFILNENTARVRLLAKSLYQRTGGNPLYLQRFLDNLYREKKLYFDEEQAIWTWDAAAVKQMPEDPDVLHLIETRLHKLPHETIGLLAVAAAIGHRFYPVTIALVSEDSLPHTLKLLRSAEEEGLICREYDSDVEETDESSYTFLHDQVQQAAYMTVSESDKAGLHLRIGRVMRSSRLDQNDESIFDMVYHLNLGCGEMEDEAEKRELAEYNLQAGLKSKTSTAFAAALHFLEMGLRLLGDDEKGTDSLANRLMLELPECEYMCRRADRAEELLERLMTRTTDLVERSHIYLIRIAMNAYLKRDDLAVKIGLQALAEFGWKIPMKPSKAAIVKELAQTQWALFRMSNKLPHLPLNRDPLYKALSDLVMAMSISAFSLSPELTAVLYPRFVRYGLKHGNNEAFAMMLGAYGIALVYGFPRYNAGFRFIETAYLLSSSLESTALKCQIHLIMGLGMLNRNPQETAEHFEQSVHYGLESANLTFVGLSMTMYITNYIGDLHTLSARITYYEEVSRQLVDEITFDIFRIARWYVAQLQDDAGEIDDILVSVQDNGSNNTLNNKAFYTCTCKIKIAYLAGRYREALKWVERGRFYSFRQTKFQIRNQLIFQCLTLVALYVEAPQEERKNIRDLLVKQLRSKLWFGHYGRKSSAYLLIMAELQRINGNQVAAAKGFEEAIAAARAEEYGLMEGISCERASIYYRAEGIVTAADSLLADACAAYSRWGAAVKVRKLRAAYPELPLSTLVLQEEIMAAKEDNQDETAREMVLFSVDENVLIRQIAGWSGMEVSQDLMNRFLESALRYSGAEKGYVLSSQEEVFFIEAQVGGMHDPQEDASYAEAIVRYVVTTGEPVVLADASESSYAADPYIRRCHPQSILCMPVLFPGKLRPSVLYMENNLISSVFTKERLEVLELMITRMVYLKTLENSRIHMSESSDSDYSPAAVSTKATPPLVDPLTNRETEILYALSDGLSNKEIAHRFSLTEGTIKSHVFRLYGKLGVKRRGQAIARARELQLID